MVTHTRSHQKEYFDTKTPAVHDTEQTDKWLGQPPLKSMYTY